MRKFMLPLLLLVLMSIPGTLSLAAEASGNPAPAVAAVTGSPANAPAVTPLPDWANLPTQTPAPQTPSVVNDKPTFLISTCSQCITSTGCRRLHSCVLMGCC